MKVITRHILGADRVLCYSLRVTKGVAERFGGSGGMREQLTADDPAKTMDAAIWLLTALLQAGKRYADNNGIQCPPAPSEDDMLDNYDINDLMEIQKAINDAMAAGSQQDVEAEAPKNGEAGQDK